MAQNEASGRISSYVLRAISAFETLLSALDRNSAEGAIAASHYARFNLWVGSLGAHRASGGRSLEYRLRDASAIKRQIISLLEDLDESIAQGLLTEPEGNQGITSVAEENSPPDSIDTELDTYFRDGDNDIAFSSLNHALKDMGHVVDCLLRLSITIRNPAPHDHFKSRTGTNISGLYEEWDIKHAREKFPKAATSIIDRLGRASAQRREYLKYREGHANRLAEGLITETEASEFGGSVPEKATTIASSIPNYLKEGEAGAPSSVSNFARFSDNESTASMTSYAPSNAQIGQLRIPPLPKDSNLGPFRCPYCRLISTIDSKREWKKHVFGDLRPYVCTEPLCTKPNQQYQRRSDWLYHMEREHWKAWDCPFGCPDTFHSSKRFEEHIRNNHPAEKGVERLDTLQILSSHADPSKAEGPCPLCDEFQITSEKQFGVHVGTHLEQLALFALPKHGDEDGSEDNTDASNVDLKKNDDRSSDSSVGYEGSSEIEHNPGTSQEVVQTGKPDLNADGPGNNERSNKGEKLHWPFTGKSREPLGDGSRSRIDVVYTEYNHFLNIERFPEHWIADGNLRLSELIDVAIHHHQIPGSRLNVALFFKDRIYEISDTPVCKIGLVSGDRVKVLFPVDSRERVSAFDAPFVNRICSEMTNARKECENFTTAAAVKEESFVSLYEAAKEAVNKVLHSLAEFHPEGDLMTLWKKEMINQAQSVHRLLQKTYFNHAHLVNAGNSFKAAAGA